MPGPQVVSAAPNSTTGEIAAAKNAAIIMVTPLANFIGRKVQSIRGKPTTACAQRGQISWRRSRQPALPSSRRVARARSRHPRTPRPSKSPLPAAHDSTVPLALLSEAQRKNLEADGVGLTLGPPSGYVIRFTNGLNVYLTGDTGLHAEMQTVEHDFYKANLMELNYGATAVTPEAAAFAVNTLVQPAAVILSHVNEAATTDGKVRPTSRSAAFIALVKGRPVYPALSGKTMEFDGTGKCVTGCRRDAMPETPRGR